ncbi:MAG: helix-turn-helix domain-containing protein [Bacteroidetes bacterium]|nr:helix-turn-helix domain-containing protein [Bacteroidota bacterium]
MPAKINRYTENQGKIARYSKALGHPARVFIMDYLAKNSSQCCYSGDMAEELPIARSTLSQHLKELKDAGLIQGEINLTDNEIVLELTPLKGAYAEIAFHHLGIPAPEDTRLMGTMEVASGNHFGNEFNIFLRYKLSDRWQLISLFGYFRPGNLMDINGLPPKSASLFSFQVLYTR